jgi:NAD(P)H-nitrite reductase large subunit
LAAQGLAAAQGLQGFLAAQGLHGFLAAQGLAQQGLQGFCAQAAQGLVLAAIDTPGTAMAMAAAATPAARTVLNLLSLIGILFSLFPEC